MLRIAIDEALEQKPHDFDAFLALLAENGFHTKHGKHLTFVHGDFSQNIRMHSLGDGYSEESNIADPLEIRAITIEIIKGPMCQ